MRHMGSGAPDIEAAPGLGGSYPEPQRKGVRKTGLPCFLASR